MSPVGLASLLLGASLALMLCGSVTFMIGFILMPWVIGLVMVFYLVGIVSNLSGLGRAILCPATPSPAASSPKDISGEISMASVVLFFNFGKIWAFNAVIDILHVLIACRYP